MALKSIKWTVVVLGRWNPAIFTPAGIRSRFFGLAEETPIEVMVALDDIVPNKSRHDEMVVWADQQRLAVELEKCDFPTLKRAIDRVLSIMGSLPETPMSAVGVNVNYEVEADDHRLLDLVGGGPDGRLSDAGYEIAGRQIVRTLKIDKGVVNLVVKAAEEWRVLLNFEYRSKTRTELQEWLAALAGTVEAHTHKLLEPVVGFSAGEITNG